jgi:hypothetical protein
MHIKITLSETVNGQKVTGHKVTIFIGQSQLIFWVKNVITLTIVCHNTHSVRNSRSSDRQ